MAVEPMATNNRDYWAERALTRENEAYLRGANLSGKMFREYEAAAKSIRRQIDSFYSKYASKYGLTYDQAVRLLSRKEFQEWKATLGDYVATIEATTDPSVKAVLKAQLDALSANSSISRLEALQGQIDLILNDLWKRGVEQMKEELGEGFVEGYYKKSYDLQSRAGFYNEIAKIDASAVEDAVSYPWSGAMFSDRLWQSKQALVFNTREIITQGLIQGKSVGVMASALSSRMGQSYKNAERLIRTETAHIHAEADRRAYKEAGVAEYEYMAAVNERTCDTCGALDGRRFKVADAEPGVNYPPIHPNCRCTTVEYDPEEALDWLNSGEPMPKRTTYQEWYSRQTAANGQGSVEAERKKAYNIKADQEQFDAFLGVLPDGEVPPTLDAFQNVKYTNPEKWRQMKAKVRLYNSTASRGTLPEVASASAPQDKLQGYLLNHEHPRGKEKAHVINQVLGYNVENWETFQKKLLTEVQKSPVTKTVSTQFGERYTVPVILYGRKDRFLRLNTVWQIDTGGKDPHFITATPERKK